METLILFTLCYILFCVCFVFPPPEFVSVGLTIDSIFSFWIKNEADCFIDHHIRRTVVTLMTHSFMPLGYVIGVWCIASDNSIWYKSIAYDFLVIFSILMPTIASSLVFHWHKTNWKNHPIAKNLRNFISETTDLQRIARDIDSEYRSINKIIIKCNALTKVVATDNWIIRILPYTLNIAHQSDATLTVTSSDLHLYVPDRPEGSQFLTIDIKSNRPNTKSFQIRINSSDFKDLEEKMTRSINVLENVVVHGNLTDCFLKEFKQQIKQNTKISINYNLDICIGCLLAKPNVKLMTCCGDTSGENKCTMCYCKPLWCEDCMGKWFASRQDQDKPESWLSSKCPCPMCRSTFCLLDVCPLEQNQENIEGFT